LRFQRRHHGCVIASLFKFETNAAAIATMGALDISTLAERGKSA
jgi:hypothetical protein